MQGRVLVSLIVATLSVFAVYAQSPANVDAARLANADAEPQNWMALGRTGHGQYYSPLKGITVENASQLGFAWEYRARAKRGRVEHGMEATPLVVDGVMYASGPWGITFALNAKTGAEIWRYEPQVDGAYGRRACCDVVNRGVQLWHGKVYVATLDGYLVALDARTGKEIWKRDTLVDRSRPYTITGAPQIAKDKIIIGNSGADNGVRGYVSAFDAHSGELRWRFYTVPGDPAKGFENPELERAAATWAPVNNWDIGGGTVWGSFSYDSELNLVYFGTGNALPFPSWYRDKAGGDNLYTASILALDVDSGRMRWYYQTTPADQWDFDANQPLVLADLNWRGKPRKVLLDAAKNGFFYVLDRATGELLSAEKFVRVNWATHVDLKTGRPVFDPAGNYRARPGMVYPSFFGAHNWMSLSYSPETGLVYFSALDSGMVYYAEPDFTYRDGGGGNGLDFFSEKVADAYKSLPAPNPKESLLAWDPAQARAVWRVELEPHNNGGVLSTAGNLVFQGTITGQFNVYRADNGTRLKSIPVGTAIMAAPMTYSVDGEQYVAVLAGIGGSAMFGYSDAAAPSRYENFGRVLVFKLGGGDVPLPPELAGPLPVPEPPARDISPGQAKLGGKLYETYCAGCHFLPGTVHRSIYPDLMRMSRRTHDAFTQIVHGGLFKDFGMAAFADVLTLAQVDAIHDYLIGAQRRLYSQQVKP